MRLGKRLILCARPNHDLPTSDASYWFTDYVLGVARKLGIPYINLEGQAVTKENYRKAIMEQDPIFICGVGHGNPNTYTGQYNEMLLDRSVESTQYLTGRSASFMSCQWGRASRFFVDLGCLGFYGYVEDFAFVVSSPPDSYAEPFMRAHMSWDKSILEGKTHRQAWEVSTFTWNLVISQADQYSVRYMIMDRDARIFEGDLDLAPISGEPPPPPKLPCCKCGAELNNCDELIDHMVNFHGPSRAPCWLPKFLRGWFGCPLNGEA